MTAVTASGARLFPLMFGLSGPLGLPLTSRREVTRLVADALAGGINAFDTAPSYGAGEAERRLGAALRGAPRGDYFLSSKVGTVATGFQRYTKDFSPDGMRRSLEESLSRLRTDRLDLLLLHGPGPEHLTPDLFAVLTDWRKEGLFRHLGAAARGAEAIRALDKPELTWVMAPAHRGMALAEQYALETHRAAGRRIIAIETLRPGQPRWRAPRRPGDLFYLARSLAHRLASGASGASAGPADLARIPRETPQEALRWALSQAFCDLIAISTSRRSHLAANMGLARSLAERRLDDIGGRHADPSQQPAVRG
jgi:aryl-alcohol dehydrogenase-like predicted oxidoreductase